MSDNGNGIMGMSRYSRLPPLRMSAASNIDSWASDVLLFQLDNITLRSYELMTSR